MLLLLLRIIIVACPLQAHYFLPLSLQKIDHQHDPPNHPDLLSHAKQVMEDDQIEVVYYQNSEAPHPNFALVMNVLFHNVTRQQFYRLRRLYQRCGGRSRVRYSSGMDYNILDFLCPKIQATWGHTFVPATHDNNNTVYYQCYGFLLDVLQQQERRFTLSAPDPRSVFEALRQRTQWIAHGDLTIDSPCLQPGDLVLLYHDNTNKMREYTVWLDHLAMYVDSGILLEKSGSGVGTPFRLVDYKTFHLSWGLPGLFRSEIRRPYRGGRRRIHIQKDLCGVRGKFVLPQIKSQRRRLRTEFLRTALCYSYDEESGSISQTGVACPQARLIFDRNGLIFDRNGRARIPPQLLVDVHKQRLGK